MERLLCILSTMNTGGAETFLMKIYRTLDTTRFQMDFCITLAEECDYEDEITALGGKIFRIPPKSKDSKEFKRQLARIVNENGYKSVLRITSNAAGFWDLKIAKKSGAAYTIARSSNSGDGSSFVQNAVHKLSRILWMRYVDLKIAPSDLAAEYTFGKRAMRKGEVKKLNNGLDLSFYRFSEEDRSAVRAEFAIPSGTSVIGHIGRFNHQKNHSFLLKVFQAFNRNNPDSVLMLAGNGILEDNIKQEVQEMGLSGSVIFTGLRNDVPALLSAFDIFLLPSFYEGMPNVIIEAQACGVPCIVSDTVTREADLGGKIPYLPIDDPDKWERETERLLFNGRSFVDMSKYDIYEVAQQFCRYCFISKGAYTE